MQVQPSQLGCIVLAAGFSTRMGTLKPLLPLGGQAAIRMAITSCLQAGVHDVVVVVGHKYAEVRECVTDLPVWVANNADFAAGMFSSVLAGATALLPETTGFYILPADIPLVRPATFISLAQALCPGVDVVYPTYKGRRGHPPLVGAHLLPMLFAWQGQGGMRQFLNECAPQTSLIEVNDLGILLDMDVPSDYDQLQRYAVGDLRVLSPARRRD